MADSSEDARASHRLGLVLGGKYRLDRVLGIGGMATVYAATHRNRHECAVKMLHPELSMREDVRTRFLREAYIANSVKHPGAVRVQDDDIAEDGSAFLVMELLEGKGVEQLWEECGGKLTVAAAVAIVDQLLDVLAVAHANGIVHRDIKPANLFLTREGVVKVLDFGIARARDAAATNVQGTGSGMLLGTPAFMSPEQVLAKSSEIDHRTDLWAAGATLFTLVTGRIVHEGETAPQLLVNAATKPAPPLSTFAPHTPPGVAQVIDRSLAFQKTDRWPTAGAMREALREAWRATTGDPPSRAVLEAYFSADALGVASTMAAPSTQKPVDRGEARHTPAAPVAPTVDDPAVVPATRSPMAQSIEATRPPRTERANPGFAPPAPAALVGGTTAQAVSQTMGEPVTAPGSGLPSPAGRRPILVGIAMACGVALAGGAALLAMKGNAPPARAAPSTAATSSAPLPAAPPAGDAAARAATEGMVRFAGGSFDMGPSVDGDDKGKTKHATIDPFWMDRTETTVAAWTACAQAKVCASLPLVVDFGKSLTAAQARSSQFCNGRDASKLGDHPINCVTAADAETFCKWAGKRLPTEAEWEYAARATRSGPGKRMFPWGSAPPDGRLVNACGPECVAFLARERLLEPGAKVHAIDAEDDGFPTTAPVGRFLGGQTDTGLYDMAGNVEEWTADSYVPYGGEAATYERVVRGGSCWTTSDANLRTTRRDSAGPEERDVVRGFRCARDASAP